MESKVARPAAAQNLFQAIRKNCKEKNCDTDGNSNFNRRIQLTPLNGCCNSPTFQRLFASDSNPPWSSNLSTAQAKKIIKGKTEVSDIPPVIYHSRCANVI